jgi:enoyl-CoA hydratase/carnithine racemase
MNTPDKSTVAVASELLFEKQAGIVRLTLNRPGRRNALSLDLLQQLESALKRIAADDQARVVVIAGAGSAFCAGHDLSEMTGRDEAEYRELFSTCAAVMQGLRKLPQPVIARVQGMATAAGCQLVASCDLAVAATEAQFATPGVKIGLFCTTPMVPLVRAVPSKLALEMLFTGAPISAERALAAGLVNRVVPKDQLDAAVDEFCDAILASSSSVLALGKAAFYNQLSCDEATAYERAVAIITDNATRADAQEGISAFLEKRLPVWRDGDGRQPNRRTEH